MARATRQMSAGRDAPDVEMPEALGDKSIFDFEGLSYLGSGTFGCAFAAKRGARAPAIAVKVQPRARSTEECLQRELACMRKVAASEHRGAAHVARLFGAYTHRRLRSEFGSTAVVCDDESDACMREAFRPMHWGVGTTRAS